MALRALMIRKKLNDANKAMDSLREKETGFATREADLEKSIEEAETEEERTAVEEAIEAFETERAENTQAMSELDKQIKELEDELAEEERGQETDPEPEAAPKEREDTRMETRAFFGMNAQERDAFFAREEVKRFLGDVRDAITNKRALTNVGLTVPEVMVPMIRQITYDKSKLLPKVNRVSVSGKARQNVMGTIPEAVWTEMCGVLNELSLGFNDVEVDGYKLGGYFEVCNANLEDSDIDLANTLINAIGASMAKAADKAIVFGTGTKMPLGFVTRLAQTASPSGYPSTARTWQDLHTSNIVANTVATGKALFQKIVEQSGLVTNDYYDDEITYIMNRKTHTKILAESIGINANAAIVAGMGNTMPVIGGDIVELSAMADNDIAFGYLDAYLWADRAGVELAQSEHYKFVEDKTVFKGTMRADGKPAIAEAFAIINIANTSPTTVTTFASDTANTQ